MTRDAGDWSAPTTAAARAGIARSTLADWIRRGIVVATDGLVHLPSLHEVVRQRREVRPARRVGSAEEALGHLRRVQTERLALANERTRGRLVPRSWIEEQFASRAALIERDLGELGTRLVAEFVRLGVPEVRARRLPEELDLLVRHYARDLPPPPPPPHGEAEEAELPEDANTEPDET